LRYKYSKKEVENYELKLTEYEDKYKIELPDRYSFSYLMIESFNDYEYTNNIAYEMVRRNEEFKTLTKMPFSERTDDYMKKILDLGLPTNIISFPEETYPFIVEKKKRFFHESWFSHTIDDVKNGLEKLIIYYYEKDKIFTLSNEANTNNLKNYIKINYLPIEEILKNPTNYYIPCSFTDFIRRADTNNKIRMQKIENGIPLRILEEIFLNRLKPSDIKFKLTELMPYYSKPKLSFPQSTIVTIPINLNLEPDEIISYVLKAKEEYSQKDLKIKHPLELIGNEFKLSKKLDSEKELPKEKGKRKKAIADAFYVYDLFKILTYYFKEKTQEIKNKRNNEITEIRKSLRYLKKEKKDRLEEYKNMYKDNINLYSKSQLKNIIADITNLSVHKVERYLKYMKECIENKKYKELITGKLCD
jgi:hypothetical protein